MKAHSPLLPPRDDFISIARFEQAISIEMTQFDPPASGICIERIFGPLLKGAKTDEVRVSKLIGALEIKLDGYERILARQPYLAGDEVTLADLFHLPWGSVLATVNVNLLEDGERFPNVCRSDLSICHLKKQRLRLFTTDGGRISPLAHHGVWYTLS
jgi:glutathione S-transferase